VSGRFALARALGSSAGWLSRLTGRGSGTTIGGRVLLAIDPGALRTAAAGRALALVSGTNGKTTTRSLLVAALATRTAVVSNAGGANLPAGLTAALAADRRAERGVLEVDEPYLPGVVRAVRPAVVVLLNLSRDQLDRYAEVRHLAELFRDVLAAETAASSTTPVAIANADDPLIAWAAAAAPAVRWVAAESAWRQDATSCPACGAVIDFSEGGWACAGCDLRRPEPNWWLDGDTLIAPDGHRRRLRLALPGRANLGNAAMAAAAATALGADTDAAIEAMAAIRTVEGRYLTTRYAGRPVRLLLAKNPAGWQQALSFVPAGAASVVVSVNARAADGRDPAWLWDVAFEQLRGRHVVATGERSRDVAVRLRYAGVEHTRVDDPGSAIRAAGGTGQVDVLANYTAFQAYRRLVGDARVRHTPATRPDDAVATRG
jgi:UDP-N-acetylmuramyl tripeptide synthase